MNSKYSIVHPQLRLRYALLKGTAQVLHFIDDVPNGLKCNCICPHCGNELVARNNPINKREHHFAHRGGADCKGARMTALHMLAQNVLERDKIVMLPSYNTEYVTHDAQLKVFDDVVLEQVWKDESSTRKPDCVCSQKDGKIPLWVEIFCRHKVDDIREQDIRRRQVYCIEIDFSDLLAIEYTEEDVINRLTIDTEHRKWISCPVWDKENEREHQKVLDENEREARAIAALHEASNKEYNRLKNIVDEWVQKHDKITSSKVIEEIKRKPFCNPNDEQECCIYNILVPNGNWVEFVKHNPKTEEGRKVFYTLIHYYVRANFNHTPLECYWVESKISDLLGREKYTNSTLIQLEYFLVLWVLNKLEEYRYYENQESQYGKVFAQNEEVRRTVLDLICAEKRNWQYYLAHPKAHNIIVQNFNNIEGGDEVIAIIRICFPLLKEKDNTTEEQSHTNTTEKQLYGHDKILAEHHMTESEAWAELNKMFNDQENQRKGLQS